MAAKEQSAEDEATHTGCKVIIAVDDSPQAEQALEYYLTDVHKPGYHVTLIYVAEPPYVASGNIYLTAELWGEMLRQERIHAKTIEEKFAQKLKSSQISGKIKTIFYAKPGETIVEHAANEKATLVVLGTRGMGTIRRTVLGSVSDFVLHHVHCPVLICRH